MPGGVAGGAPGAGGGAGGGVGEPGGSGQGAKMSIPISGRCIARPLISRWLTRMCIFTVFPASSGGHAAMYAERVGPI